MSAILFADIQRFLALFAQGLSGRALHLQPVDGSEAAARIRLPCHDCLDLPHSVDYFCDAAANFTAYRLMVIRALQACAPLPRTRYEHWFAASPRPRLSRALFAMLERMRIDAVAFRHYPGARTDLARLQAHERARAKSLRPAATAAAHVAALAQLTKGTPPAMILARLQSDLLRDIIGVAHPIADADSRPRHSAVAALRIAGMLDAAFGHTPRPSQWHDIGVVALAPDGVHAPHEVGAGSWDAPADATQSAAPQNADPAGQTSGAGSDAAAHADRARPAAAPGEGAANGHHGDELATPGSGNNAARATAAGPRSYLYDEWDFHSQSYLRSWCRVFEHRLTGNRAGFLNAVKQRHAALFHEVRRQFSLLRPDSRQRVRHAADGDDLDLDSVIDTVIDRRAGLSPDARPYVQKERRRRDVAAAFLIDMSASTDFRLTPEESGRRVIDAEKDALVLMCSALQTLGDSFAVYGFSGDGRHNVEFQVAKDFRDRMDARAWSALAAIEPRRSTRMGPAIRHAAGKLAREPAGMRVLIILSDGYPEDRDYGPDRNDHEYGIEDTARALEEVRRAGVLPFCVTIDPAGHDYLRRMCPQSRYRVIDDVEALPRELSKLYRALTG